MTFSANDIALLKLEKRINFSKFEGTVAPICLPSESRTYYREKVTVAGWGLLSDGGQTPDKVPLLTAILNQNTKSNHLSSYKKST